MISKKMSLLVIGFNYEEINCIQDELSKEFSHFNFDFAISVRDSWYRLNISDYDVVLLDLTSSEIDSILALQEIYRNGDDIDVIVTVNSNEISKISNTISINPHHFIIKDENFISKFINLIKNDADNSNSTISIYEYKMHPLFQILLNTVHDRVMVIGMDYRIKLVNQKIGERFNCAPQDIVGKRCYEFAYNFDKPCSENNLICPLKEISSAGQSCRLVHTHKNPDKSQLTELQISAFPLNDELNSIVEVLVAIKEDTVPLEQSQVATFDKKLLEVLINGISDGLFFCNSENKVILSNRAVESLLEIGQEHLLNKSVFDIPLDEGVHWLKKVLQSAKSNVHITTPVKIQLKDKWILLRYTPVYDSNGQYMGGFLYLTDLSSKRLFDEKQKGTESDILSITKFFPAKIVAEG